MLSLGDRYEVALYFPFEYYGLANANGWYEIYYGSLNISGRVIRTVES